MSTVLSNSIRLEHITDSSLSFQLAAEQEELNHEREEKLREDELLDIGRPVAPVPSSRYKISSSSIASTRNERKSSQVCVKFR